MRRPEALAVIIMFPALMIATLLSSAHAICGTHILQYLRSTSVSDLHAPASNNTTSIVQAILLPQPPVVLHLGETTPIVFRTSTARRSETIRIYLARYTCEDMRSGRHIDPDVLPKRISELGRQKVGAGTYDHLMLWTPSMDIEVGDGYVLMFMHTRWWGWRKKEVYESFIFRINHLEEEPSTARYPVAFRMQQGTGDVGGTIIAVE